MKLFNEIIIAASCGLFTIHVVAETATDRLLEKIIDQQVPAIVHEARDLPWAGGTYAIRIVRNGAPVYKSGARDISVSLPLRAEMEGNAGLLNTPIVCRATFTTMARVDVAPDFSAETIQTKSKVSLPIPPVMADCGVIQFPVDSFLKQLVAENKPQWEFDIDKALNTELKKLTL